MCNAKSGETDGEIIIAKKLLVVNTEGAGGIIFP